MPLRDFLKSTLKGALAIFIAGLGLVAVFWFISDARHRADRQEAEAYEAAKVWRGDVKEHLQMDLYARTKLVGGKLLVALQADAYPAYLDHPKSQYKNQNAHLIVSFEDKDGFKVYEKPIKMSEFSTTVDASGRKIGLNHQFDQHVSVSDYKSFAHMTVRWTLDTVIPPPPKAAVPTPKTTVVDGTDHCAPGLTKIERLRRLAKHGEVRQASGSRYTVGYREVAFYSDGDLLSCR